MNSKYTDVMIDLETLGDTPDSIPVQMGVVFFDLENRTRQRTGGVAEIDPVSGAELGFIQTRDTVEWWKTNGRPIPGQDPTTSIPLVRALYFLRRSLADLAEENVRVWSRGNSFDLAILKLAYKRCMAPPPWQFWRERDVRTYLEALSADKGAKNTHDAFDDAMNQVDDLQRTADERGILVYYPRPASLRPRSKVSPGVSIEAAFRKYQLP